MGQDQGCAEMDLSQNVIESPAHDVCGTVALSCRAERGCGTVDIYSGIAEFEYDGGTVARSHPEMVGVVSFHADLATSSVKEYLIFIASYLYRGEENGFVCLVELDCEGRYCESSSLIDDESPVQLEI